MLWDRSNRFTNSKKDETILTYESFSDYLRHQFLQSRNLFHHYQEYRKKQKNKKQKQEARKIQDDLKLPPQHHIGEEGITPATSLTEDGPHKEGNQTFYLTQTNETGEDHVKGDGGAETQQPKFSKSKKKKHGKLVLLKSKVLPSYLDNSQPGPGSYHHPESFVKPSFNRVYTEPPPIHKKAKGGGLRNYLRPTTSLKKRILSKPLWNGTREKPTLLRTQSAQLTIQASFDHTAQRPASAKPYAESFRNPYATAKASLTPDGRTKKQEQVYGKRYPPVSEKLIRRWTSYSHDSYPDYSKPSLVSPQSKTMLNK